MAKLHKMVGTDKMEEKIMLMAVQDLRRKTLDDEIALETAQAELQVRMLGHALYNQVSW